MAQSLPVLHRRFHPPQAYRAQAGAGYALLPFRFLALDSDRYILTNFAGEHIVLPRASLYRFIRHELEPHSQLYNDLKSRHFLLDAESSVALDLLAAKYRTKQSFVSSFTSLFMFVTTLRCDHSCRYCQVSRQSEDRVAFDMSPQTADLAVDFMFRSPSPSLKVEFQGGESLLNFDVLRRIVERVEERNTIAQRDVSFVIATNLAPLSDEHLRFCLNHRIDISTSLDGPRELHNKNRPQPGRDSYGKTIEGIRRTREVLGHDRVAALMTTTRASLSQPRQVVDEYVAQGFSSIFLRAVSPYGFAIRNGLASEYSIEEWLAFYFEALSHIIELNQRGIFFREEYASLLLQRILSPYATGYVDLQSPAGIGISCLVFNYDGAIYASDESRMLAEMGDTTFRLGSLHENSFEEVMSSEALLGPLRQTITEGMPMCSDCGIQPYCGSDPVRHYKTQGDVVGFKPTSDHCRKHMAILRHLIRLLEDDEPAARVLRSWL